jgi:hypothetical protein
VQVALVPSTKPRVLVIAAVVVLGLIAAVAVAGTITRTDGRTTERIALSSIPAGASVQEVGTRAVAFVRDGDAIAAFVPAVGRADGLEWCEGRGIFTTVLSASHYAADGTKLGGPGPDQLERYDVRMDGDDVLVSTSHRFDLPTVPWSDALASRFAQPSGELCTFPTG